MSETSMDVETSETSLKTADPGSSTSTQASTSTIVQPPTKRLLVDINGSVLPDPKRSRADPVQDEKTDAYALILHWHEYLMRAFSVEDHLEINAVADLTSILWTIHTKLRQQVNGNGGVHNLINDDFEFKANDVANAWKVLRPQIIKIAALYHFIYENNDRARARIGTLGSILSFIVSFRSRLHEVRMGTTNFTVQKQGNTTRQLPISAFGLRQEHSIFMTGSSFNPTLQSSMKMSLGPLTTAVNLCMQTQSQFQEPWKRAFVNAFKLLPEAQEIANILAGSRNENDTILRLLGDLSMFGIARSSNKAAFPASFFLSVARRKSEYAEFFSRVTPNTAIPSRMVHEAIKGIDLSGQGAFKFWHMAAYAQYTLKAKDTMTARTKQELVFHSVWGTAKENLSLLGWMTGHSFQTRREMGATMRGRGTRDLGEPFQLLRFLRISKLSSAAQTDFIAGGKGQICRGPTFSGKCHQRIDLEGDLFKILCERRDEYVDRSSTKARIISKLVGAKKIMEDRIRREVSIAFATSFYAVQREGGGYGDPVDAPQLQDKYFYGHDT